MINTISTLTAEEKLLAAKAFLSFFPGWERLTDENRDEIASDLLETQKTRITRTLARQGDREGQEQVEKREARIAAWRTERRAERDAEQQKQWEVIKPFEKTQSYCLSLLLHRLTGENKALLQSYLRLDFPVNYYSEKLPDAGKESAISDLCRTRRILQRSRKSVHKGQRA